jgi:hypothetical protein
VGNKLTVTEVAVGSMTVTGVTVTMTVATVAVLIVTVPGPNRRTDTRLTVTMAVETGTRGMLLTTDLGEQADRDRGGRGVHGSYRGDHVNDRVDRSSPHSDHSRSKSRDRHKVERGRGRSSDRGEQDNRDQGGRGDRDRGDRSILIVTVPGPNRRTDARLTVTMAAMSETEATGAAMTGAMVKVATMTMTVTVGP